MSGGDESFRKLNRYCLDRGVDLTATVAAHSGEHSGVRGTHYLYRAPAGGLKGKAKAFGPDLLGLDTRGIGQYICVDPTLHITNVRYRWVNWLDDAADCPELLVRLLDPPPPRRDRETLPVAAERSDIGKYTAKALKDEIDAVLATTEGGRNDRLNTAAFNLGQLVAAGKLDYGTVYQELHRAGVDIGLSATEAGSAIASGLRGGASKPRAAVAGG